MFINDDGLQIIDEEERRARIDFYADNCIGWTARPKHGFNGFRRKGKFKKVSPFEVPVWALRLTPCLNGAITVRSVLHDGGLVDQALP